MVNLFTYLSLIEDFFNQHLQVNSIFKGDKSDLTAKNDIVYPMANIEYLDKAIKEDEDVYRYEIIIADLWSEEIELSIINDCNSIADDLVNYFEDVTRFEDLEIFSNVTIKPFTDSFGDRVAGVTFVISLTGFRKACTNTIPANIAEEGGFTYALDFPLA